MSIRNEIFDIIFSECNDRREAAKSKALAVLAVVRSDEDFAKIDTELKLHIFAVERALVRGQDTKSLDEKEKALKKKWLKALEKTGYAESDLSPKFSCAKCDDTGKAADGKLCTCVLPRFFELASEKCGISQLNNCSFSAFDESRFESKSHLDAALALKRYFETYSAKYPAVKYPDFLLMGATGVGKTFLAGSLAFSLAEKGVFLKFTTAFELHQTMLAYHLAPYQERGQILSDILTADVLFIDDLGTEPILKNVTLEYLYLILSERQRCRRATITTTNLSLDNLTARYGDRIASRLTDQSIVKSKQLLGTDLRKTKK